MKNTLISRPQVPVKETGVQFQMTKIKETLATGVRKLGNGETKLLSEWLRRQLELRLRAFKAKQGKVIYSKLIPALRNPDVESDQHYISKV